MWEIWGVLINYSLTRIMNSLIPSIKVGVVAGQAYHGRYFVVFFHILFIYLLESLEQYGIYGDEYTDRE